MTKYILRDNTGIWNRELYGAIRKAVGGFFLNKNIKIADAEETQTLVLNNVNCIDLDFLKFFPNLERLNISGHSLQNIDGLFFCKKLQELDIDIDKKNSDYIDFSIIGKLIQLKYLYLHDCNLNNIDWISNLKDLVDLNLSCNQITDISKLRGLSRLSELDLTNCNVSDVSSLEDSFDIEFLTLNGNNIKDISSLSNLKKLTYICYKNCSHEDAKKYREKFAYIEEAHFGENIEVN